MPWSSDLMGEDATILIRTMNEAQCIEETLRLIKRQIPEPREIIVVDSGSTDGTADLLRERVDVKLIEILSSEFTFGRALNIGFEAALTDYVVPMSAHAFPCDRYWLKSLLDHFGNPRVAAVYGRQLAHLDAWPPVRRDYLASPFGNELRLQLHPDNVADHFFSNANAAIRRDLWVRCPFDEELPYCEDWDWARKILQMDYQIVYEPKAAVYHSHNESFWKLYQRTRREYEAQKILYAREQSVGSTLLEWLAQSRKDIDFIRQEGEARKWLFWSPLYRWFWAYGTLRPSLPRALWRPLMLRLRRESRNPSYDRT